jgi:hypothetical protein
MERVLKMCEINDSCLHSFKCGTLGIHICRKQKQATLEGPLLKTSKPKFKLGEYIMQKYRWHDEPDYDYLFRVISIDKDGVDVELVAAKENGKWILRHEQGDHFNWGISRMWDFVFKLGNITPTNGWGKAFKYKGELP